MSAPTSLHQDMLIFKHWITAFSNDGVYLYSTYDDPENEKNLEMSGPLSLEHERRSEKGKIPELQGYDSIDIDAESSSYREDNGPQFAEHEGGEGRQTNSTDQDDDMTDVDDDEYGEDYFNLWRGDERNYLLSVPVVLPRQRYSGARNIATIKDGKSLRGFTMYMPCRLIFHYLHI